MAYNGNQVIRPGRCLGLSAHPMMATRQVTACAVVKGQPVYIDGNGFLDAWPSDSVTSDLNLQVAASAQGAGIAASPGAAVAGVTDELPFYPILEGLIFEGNLVDGTDLVGPNNHTLAQTDLGELCCPTLIDGETQWAVNIDVTGSRDCARIVELIDPIGTVNGRVGFQFRQSFRQLGL